MLKIKRFNTELELRAMASAGVRLHRAKVGKN
jgi:hypothetical protein